MKAFPTWIHKLAVALGFAALALFVFDFFILLPLYDPMQALDVVAQSRLDRLTWVGFGFLAQMGFSLLALLVLLEGQRRRDRLGFSLVLILAGVLNFLMSFSDIALLSDIAKEYAAGFSQAEWPILFGLLLAQTVISLTLLVALLVRLVLGRKEAADMQAPQRDSSVFLMVQWVGLLSGALGLASAALGFAYPRAYQPSVHTLISLVVLSLPYALAVAYWALTRARQTPREWYDEKQILDVGRAAFLTLILSTLGLAALFIAHFQQLDGMLAQLWFPVYLFGVLLVFSLSNLYFSWRG